MTAGKSEDFVGQVYGRRAMLLPTTANLIGLYQRFQRRAEGLVGEWVRLVRRNGNAVGIDQIYGRLAKLWPAAANLTALYEGFLRRSEGLVGECVTVAKKNGQNVGKVYRFLGSRAPNRDAAGAPDPRRR